MYPTVFLIYGLLSGIVVGPSPLVDQSSDCAALSGNALSVSFFRSTNVESADDFVVPDGKLWRPTRIYAQGSVSLQDRQVRVRIYPDEPPPFCIGRDCPQSVPASPPVCSVVGTASFSAIGIGFNPFNVDLPADACELGEGRYWLSVAREDNACGITGSCEDWHWDETTQASSTQSWVIRDPDNARRNISCTTFGPAGDCLTDPVEANLCFDLLGSQEDVPPPAAGPSLAILTLRADELLVTDLNTYFDPPPGQNLTFSAPDLPSFLTLSADGTLQGTAGLDQVDSNLVFAVRGTDSLDRFDELQVALRIINPQQFEVAGGQNAGLGLSFEPGELLRCGSGVSGTGTLLSSVDFSQPGSCGDGTGAECGVLDPGATVVGARLALTLDHPMVSDLKVSLTSPQGNPVALLDRPLLFDLRPEERDCPNANVRAVFSDVAPWPVEEQCESPTAIVGQLEPQQPLGTFRNELAANSWELTVENLGDQSATVQQWCLALQSQVDSPPIYAQEGLPGAATVVDFAAPLDTITFTGTLTDEDDVHWYFLDQGLVGVRVVDTELIPVNGQPIAGYRYSVDKFPGRNPTHAVVNCGQAGIARFPSFVPAFGSEYYRVQGCPGTQDAEYELTVSKDLSSGFRGFQPRSGARFRGEVRDEDTGDLIPLAFVTDGSSTAFTNPDGVFSALVDVGEQTVNIFHPDYLPGSVQALGVEEQTTEVGVVNLTPLNSGMDVDEEVFGDGFETF